MDAELLQLLPQVIGCSLDPMEPENRFGTSVETEFSEILAVDTPSDQKLTLIEGFFSDETRTC